MMILRVVRMHFIPEQLPVFEDLFAQYHGRIEAMPGCKRVMLLKELGGGSSRTTLSWWLSEAALNAYRDSDLFAEIWPATKALFHAKPAAWTLHWDDPVPSTVLGALGSSS